MGEEWTETFYYDQKYIDNVHRNVDRILESLKRNDEMPLIGGKKAKTRKGFGENVKREMEAGKPQRQSVAIAYSKARGGKKRKRK